MTENEVIVAALDRLADSVREQMELLTRIAVALEERQPRKQKAIAPADDAPTPGARVWHSYAACYSDRYRVEPVRNAKVNSLCSQLAKQLGPDAPEVAAFYVRSHNDRLYLNSRHALELLVRDAAKIRTDWKRGVAPTSKDAGNEERLSYAKSQMERIERGEL